MHRKLTVLGALLAATATLASCSVIGAAQRAVGLSGHTYHVTAYFSEAVALYPKAPVTVMGVRAGTVESVAVDGTQVKVTMDIDSGVPLATTLSATIGGLSLIGERSVVLSAWKPGQPRVSNGFVIPEAQTVTPVEPDQGLQSFISLLNSIEPSVISELVTNGAKAFAGHAQNFHDLIDTSSSMVSDLGAQDQRIIAAANQAQQLISLINQQPLGKVIDDFSQVTSILAGERSEIGTALQASLNLVNSGTALLNSYGGQIPSDLATLTRLGQTIRADLPSFSDFFKQINVIANGLLQAYDPRTGSISLATDLPLTLGNPVSYTITRLLCAAGLSNLVAKVEPGSSC